MRLATLARAALAATCLAVAGFSIHELSASVPAPAAAMSPDEAAVRAALEHYLQGHATGGKDHFRAAFRPEAHMYGLREGKLAVVPIEQYIERGSGQPAPDEAQRRRRIERVDIAGTAATGKIVLDYPKVTFTDYMTLLKVDGEWRIVSKVYHAEPKPAATSSR